MQDETNPDNAGQQPVHPPRSVKIEDSVYQKLDNARLHRETFSNVISRLLRTSRKLSELAYDAQVPGFVRDDSPEIWNKVAWQRSDPVKQPEHQVTEPAASGR